MDSTEGESTSEEGESTRNNTDSDTINRLREAIWNKLPILSDIIAKRGSKTLFDYAQDFFDVNSSPLLDGRKAELINVATSLITERLGITIGEEVRQQLTHKPLVSTADHHGPIDHPFFINSNIISALPYFNSTDDLMKYLIVFSFSSVSINNSSYPRGISFHVAPHNVATMRLPLLPDREKMGIGYSMRTITREDITRATLLLEQKTKQGEIAEETFNAVMTYLEKTFSNPGIVYSPDFVSQITRLNYELWPFLFDRRDTQKLPNLVYLEIETLVTRLLLDHHFEDPNSLLYKLIFTEQGRQLALKYFNNLPGAFSLEKEWGTFLFWGIDQKGRRSRLFFAGDHVKNSDGSSIYPFTIDAFSNALKEKNIFPSMTLCYVVVALYYGMKCLGGFAQVHDLSRTKEVWRELLLEWGEQEEFEALCSVQTKEFGGDGLVLLYRSSDGGSLTPATGVDMFYSKKKARIEDIIPLSKMITLSEAIGPMLPEIYRVLYSEQDRDPVLAEITGETIFTTTGLQEKFLHAYRVE